MTMKNFLVLSAVFGTFCAQNMWAMEVETQETITFPEASRLMEVVDSKPFHTASFRNAIIAKVSNKTMTRKEIRNVIADSISQSSEKLPKSSVTPFGINVMISALIRAAKNLTPEPMPEPSEHMKLARYADYKSPFNG